MPDQLLPCSCGAQPMQLNWREAGGLQSLQLRLSATNQIEQSAAKAYLCRAEFAVGDGILLFGAHPFHFSTSRNSAS